MKVKDLLARLERENGEAIVILQKDGEGNGYSPLQGIANDCNYKADSTWSGEVGYKKLTPSLKKMGYTKEDCLEGEDAIILFPVN